MIAAYEENGNKPEHNARGAVGRWINSHMMDLLKYFSFQSVLHNWCKIGHGQGRR